jgi:hypothetical protein
MTQADAGPRTPNRSAIEHEDPSTAGGIVARHAHRLTTRPPPHRGIDQPSPHARGHPEEDHHRGQLPSFRGEQRVVHPDPPISDIHVRPGKPLSTPIMNLTRCMHILDIGLDLDLNLDL